MFKIFSTTNRGSQEKLEWFTQLQAKAILVNSFSSIRYVVDSLKKIQGVKESN